MPSAAPPPAAGNGVPPSELEQLQLRAGQVTDDVSFVYAFFTPIGKLSDIPHTDVICFTGGYHFGEYKLKKPRSASIRYLAFSTYLLAIQYSAE